MVNSFASSFWDTDWDGTKGYDILVTRLKDGKKLYDAYLEFVRTRAKLEDDHGKRLIQLARTAGGCEETGTLLQSWSSVKKETENIGIIHCELAKKLNELVERVAHHREKQKQERLRIDEAMRNEQKEKKEMHETVVKAKRLYEQRCKELDAATEALDSKATYTPKEQEKMRKTKGKCKTLQEEADSSYHSSVKRLEELRKKYIHSMGDACEKFQTIEEQRIMVLREEMWSYTNLGSTQLINVSGKYEECRRVLEKCNHKQDIQAFITKHHIGSTPPQSIEYVNYYHKGTMHANNIAPNHTPDTISKQAEIVKSSDVVTERTPSPQPGVHAVNPLHIAQNKPRSQQQQQQIHFDDF